MEYRNDNIKEGMRQMSNYVINVLNKKGIIDKNIYGNFSEHLGRCIYGGVYVGEDSPIPNTKGMRNDVVNALKQIRLPVLRWPGGCFADEYHWKDGIGPKEQRKKMINSHWGGTVEDNSFGTHEFFELCSQVGCEPYVCGNVGSGTVEEMSEWIEYINFDALSPMSELRRKNGNEKAWNLKYFGVGNESWGCGGNMTAEYYANEYRRYQTFARNYQAKKLFRIASGPNSDDYHWTETLMKSAGRLMDGLSLHYYTIAGPDWQHKGSSTQFDDEIYYNTMKKTLFMDELIRRHSMIMDKYDPEEKVALVVDEWGTWFDVEPGTNPGFLYQQNTMRDAMVAGINLNIFNKHCSRVKMANIAQLANVLQAVILTEGGNMVLTPTYFVFKMYAVHQNAELLDSYIETEQTGKGGIRVPNLNESASLDAEGNIHVTLCNLDLEQAQSIDATVIGRTLRAVSGEILTNEIHAANTFGNPELVKLEKFTDASVTPAGFSVHIPAHSIVRLTLS